MAKIPVRVSASGYKGLNPGTETTMSISRARAAFDAGGIEYVEAPKKARAAKKAPAKRAAKKTATKAVRGTRNRSMSGKTTTK